MIPRDHDYAGKERDQHMMGVHAVYDGVLLWITMDGCHSWDDGCYTHQWTHAMPLISFENIVNCATNAIHNHYYQTQVLPQLIEEIGGEDGLQMLFFDNRGDL